MVLAREAYFTVDRVLVKLEAAGDSAASMEHRLLPPRDSCEEDGGRGRQHRTEESLLGEVRVCGCVDRCEGTRNAAKKCTVTQPT